MALLSRVADSLWWTGRYLERAENVARLLTVHSYLRFEPGGGTANEAENISRALWETLGVTMPGTNPQAALERLALDLGSPTSVRSALRAARENARAVREYLSRESFEALNRTYRELTPASAPPAADDQLTDFCDDALRGLDSVRGALESTCMHDEGWWWLVGGMAIERADMSTRIVDAKFHLLLRAADEVGGPADRYQWAALLRSVSGWEAYRRLHSSGIDPVEVTQFLLLDPAFPRSLRASVETLTSALNEASAETPATLRNPPLLALSQLQSRLRYESAGALLQRGLHEALDSVQDELEAVNEEIAKAFFGRTADSGV